MQIVEPHRLDLSQFVRRGDTVVWGQACAEPQSLTEALVEQRARIGRFRALIGANFSKTFAADHADHIDFVGTGAVGNVRHLAKAGVVDIVPFHITSCDRAIDNGWLRCDVVLIQLSPPDEQGRYSVGLTSDWIRTAVRHARVVIAEVNAQVPQTRCSEPLTDADIHVRVDTDRPPLEVGSAVPGETDMAIARHALEYIPDRAVVQVGIGSVPDALVPMLKDHKDLGIHSGMIGDSVVDLIQAGVVTNAHKDIDRGVTITGALLGTRKLYDFCHRNPAVKLAPVSHTHDIRVVGALSNFISLNSAVEVDLSGQVNAEAIGRNFLGAVGGQLDYGRAAALSPGGRSIIALPSVTADGRSRIVAGLNGPVTTPRSDADLIITEYGVAELRAKPFGERIRALIAIAHPSHREALEREAFVAGAMRG
ncbi:MAG TPA: acetyl-CoA hydrolase/transferase C-terminal domain-containing protein [Sphingobium sp.]|nr:acetyl-CoA hydrolase/transferase C-terminal domain-containing protein [Sphingobium sp.]